MNLWFRLSKLLLKRPWRYETSPDSTIITTMRVWPFDLDINRHVTNGRYFSMADVARMDFLFRSGAYKVALRYKALPIVGDNWGKFRKELKLFQKFEIHTRMLGWDEKWVFVQHDFQRHGRILGSVIMRGVFRAGRDILKPTVFVESMALPEESPKLPQWVAQWSNCCDNLSEHIRKAEASSLKME